METPDDMLSTPQTAQLVSRARAGDDAAMRDLMRRFEGELRGYVRRRGASRVDPSMSTDDVVQETMIEAFRSLPNFEYRRRGSYLAWLYTIARRRVARVYERAKRSPPPLRFAPSGGGMTTGALLGALADGATSPAEQVDRRQRRELLAEALAELSERRRDAIVLHYFEGLTGPEAAAVLGVQSGNFRVLLLRARKQLATLLDEALADPSADPSADVPGRGSA